MEYFNINKVIEHYNLNTDEISKVLFPNIKYPKLALDRVLKNEAVLNVNQIEDLASYLGVLISDLFFVENNWKGIVEDRRLTLIKGPYKVKLNYVGTFMTIYKDNKVLEHNIVNPIRMTITEFIKSLDNFIKNH